MSNSEEVVNESIMQMITNLKPRVTSEFRSTHSENNLKRSMSTSSNGSIEDSTPVKKMKLPTTHLNTSYVGSPREVRRMRADLLEARNTILSLENQIKHMHSVRKEMQIMFDNETVSLRQQHEHDRKSIEELEAHLQCIRKREAEAKAQLAEVTSAHEKLKLTSAERIQELENQLNTINVEKQSLIDMKEEEVTNLKRKLNEIEIILKAAQQDAEAQHKLNEELSKSLSEKKDYERQIELKEQALQKAHMKIKELEFARESYLEFKQQAKTQQHKISHYVVLEKENKQLRDENVRIKDEIGNKLLLEEEVHDLRNRLVNFKEHEKRLASLQVAHTQMEMQLEEWRAVARGICESTGSDSMLPHLLRKTVERLQHQEINLTAEKVQLESQLNTALHEAKLARSELEKSQKHITDLQSNVQERQTLIHRMQKKLLLISRERDSYRQQLDSYEKDLTMCLNPPGNQTQMGTPHQTQRERIESLEKIIEGYRDMVARLENDLQSCERVSQSDMVPARAEQLENLQKQVEQLKNENQRLRDRKDKLEIYVEQYLEGVDRHEGHIYHQRMNPTAEYQMQQENKITKLEEEVERLKRKIKNMEEGLEGSKIDVSFNPKEKQALQEEIKSLENQNQRLKEFFKSSTQEFRNVVYMLLGYKVDKTSSSQYRLTSMYAETSEDCLAFQLNQDGVLNLLENPFSARLEELVDLHLRHQNSIPMFLSAITVALFSSRTMTTRTYEID